MPWAAALGQIGGAASSAGGASAAGGAGAKGMLGKMGGGGGGGLGGIIQKGVDVSKRTTQAGVSGITSLIQGIQAKRLKDKANAAMPELVDPGQAAFLSELNQKRRSIDTGADFAAGMQAIDATNAGTNDALVRNGGGDSGGTIQALLQSERVAGDSKNNVLAQGQNQQMAYNSMYGDLLNKMSARKMQLQLLQSQQARAEWAEKQQAASKNFMGFLGGGPMMGKKGDPSQAGNTPATAGGGSSSAGVNDAGVQSILSGLPQQTSAPATPNQVTPTVMKGQTDAPAPVTSASTVPLTTGTEFSLKK